MTNGAAALHVVPGPEPAPASTKSSGIEASIGQAAADAACALCQGMFEFQGGGLSGRTKKAGGERIAALFQLQEAHAGQINFPITAYEQGAKVLRGLLQAEGFFRSHSPDAGEAMIDLALTSVLDILAKVTTFERALH